MNIPEEILEKIIGILTEVVDAKKFFTEFLKEADKMKEDFSYFFLLADLIPISAIKKGEETIKDFKPVNQTVFSLQTLLINKINDEKL